MQRTLDTNICSYILRRHPPDMLARFASLKPGEVWLSAIVAAELRFGATKLAAPRLVAAVEQWLAGFELRPWPLEASHRYAETRAALECAGQVIGNMDLMIAAHALAEDSVVVTSNAAEFQRVPGLAVEFWAVG
ncbi:MAG: type II toxin-antitoxin system VapC family toxin [Rhodocyclaceae bacterium]|nr:type II toxin-antitoxin system VapC family toxin [Rhodocyclaceae bacterium]